MAKRSAWPLAAACATLVAAGPAFAHHSFAMFDNSREIVLVGTVSDFQWTNPHTWIEMDVPDKAGKVTHWSIEGGSPIALARQGWKRTSVQAGDKITLTARPLKSGDIGGSLVSVVLADGKKLGASVEPPKL